MFGNAIYLTAQELRDLAMAQPETPAGGKLADLFSRMAAKGPEWKVKLIQAAS